jgi:dTDP-glucose 4,6-dehydratase
MGMQTLIELSQEHKVSKFIYVSSTDLYKHTKDIVAEDSLIHANTLAKVIRSSNEQLLQNSEMQYTILRTPTIYGPREQKENIIPSVIKSVMSQLPITIYASQAERDWLYVGELCDAINTLMDKSGIYNISANHEIPVAELLQKVCNVLNQGWNLIQYNTNDTQYTKVNIAKAVSCGWEPKLKLSKAIENTVVWYKNNAWALK